MIINKKLIQEYNIYILVLEFVCFPTRVKGCSCILGRTTFLKLQHPMKGLLLIRA
jgi:hypothetical protein